MGVRSDVAIVVYGDEDKFEQLIDVWEKLKNKNSSEDFKHDLDYLLTESENYLGVSAFSDEGFKFFVDSVKWYNGIPVIDFFEQFVIEASEIEGLNVEIARLTEGDEELETYGDDVEYRLGFRREITID